MSFVVGSERGPRADVPRAKRVPGQPTLTVGALRRIVRNRLWAEMVESGLSCAEIAAMSWKPGGEGYAEPHVRRVVREMQSSRRGA